MQFSKTLHWNGRGAAESVVNSHENTRNGIGESRAISLLSPVESSSRRQLNGAVQRKHICMSLSAKKRAGNKFTCGMALQEMEQEKRKEGKEQKQISSESSIEGSVSVVG